MTRIRLVLLAALVGVAPLTMLVSTPARAASLETDCSSSTLVVTPVLGGGVYCKTDPIVCSGDFGCLASARGTAGGNGLVNGYIQLTTTLGHHLSSACSALLSCDASVAMSGFDRMLVGDTATAECFGNGTAVLEHTECHLIVTDAPLIP